MPAREGEWPRKRYYRSLDLQLRPVMVDQKRGNGLVSTYGLPLSAQPSLTQLHGNCLVTRKKIPIHPTFLSV